MFTVIVVDDEPTSLEHICATFELIGLDFNIVDTAENGKEALEKVKIHNPDLLITDVKMPIMSGIELVSQMKEQFPFIEALIVSGYSDFDYAKAALKAGVADYVLKPISPSNLKSVLYDVQEKLKHALYKQRNKLIQSMSRGVMPPLSELKKCFPSNKYYTAIVRRNGLMKRFSNFHSIEMFSEAVEMVIVYGRDEMEELYICPEELLLSNGFEGIMRRIINKNKNETEYTTAVISKECFTVEILPDRVKKLYRALDKNTVVGYNQVLILEELTSTKQINISGQEDVLHKIGYLIKGKQIQMLKTEIRSLMLTWDKEKRPQLWLEGICRNILYMLQWQNTGFYDSENEFMLEDAFFYATCIEDLIDSFIFILDKNLNETDHTIYRLDTPEFFAHVQEYLQAHMQEQITLRTVCQQFGISQSYLSKLFSKYAGQPLNNYLISIRIERAKVLILENPNLLIKDVASMVGYNDQFYFSRIFRSITGVCPSDFIESVN